MTPLASAANPANRNRQDDMRPTFGLLSVRRESGRFSRA
jgi:hypothetical protein